MRSVVVVLPASMWAMIPMFLHRSNGTCLDTAFFLSSFRDSCSLTTVPVKIFVSLFFLSSLPPIVRKSFVGLGHAVHVFFLLDSCAAIVGGIEKFVAQLVDHAFFAASTRVDDQPANRQRGTPIGVHFHRHLVVGAAYAAGLHFEQRLDVLDRLLEELQGFVATLLL